MTSCVMATGAVAHDEQHNKFLCDENNGSHKRERLHKSELFLNESKQRVFVRSFVVYMIGKNFSSKMKEIVKRKR